MAGPAQRDADRDPTVTLRELILTLDTAVAELLEAPAGDKVVVGSACLVDGDDLGAESAPPRPVPDVYLLVGVSASEAITWLTTVTGRPVDQRPVAVMTKTAFDRQVRAAARRAGLALVAVHPQARWDQVFRITQRMLSRSQPGSVLAVGDTDLLATDTDLFDLAQMVAANAGGMVTVEDAHSKVLAYSASDESADELRTLSILGREGPREYLKVLHEWGVFDRLRNTDDVIDMPAHPGLKTRHRLAVSVREPAADGAAPRLLGSIWVQEGMDPLSPDAADVMRGASAVAARIISRSLNAPTTEGLLIQRLFGARGGGIDVPTIAAALNLVVGGPAAVIGFTAPTGDTTGADEFGSIGSLLRLHASSFRRDSLTTLIGQRAYVLLPQYKSTAGVGAWVRQLIAQFETKRGLQLCAAIAMPVADLSQVANARSEVDRVLDATAATFPDGRVTTLAESLTPVLLGEIFDLIAARSELTDPRLAALDDYDSTHDGALRASAQAYLTSYGDVRRAATMVNVHHNTLRYRLRRVEEILGIQLDNPADRLLLELQLVIGDRRQTTTAHRR
jgi:DNA-binding PucR family transcriptional regulator